MPDKPQLTMQTLVTELFGDELTEKKAVATATIGVRTTVIRHSSAGRQVKLQFVNGDASRYYQRETDNLITVSINLKKVRSQGQLNEVLATCRECLLGA